jgi:hypothetical protein
MTSFTLDLPTNEPITLDYVTKQELAILKNMRNPPELVMRILLAVLSYVHRHTFTTIARPFAPCNTSSAT